MMLAFLESLGMQATPAAPQAGLPLFPSPCDYCAIVRPDLIG
jgi:hypothetical protein